MNEVWQKIFKDYIQNYYSIYNLSKSGIIDTEEKSRLREKLLDEIITTFESEVNE